MGLTRASHFKKQTGQGLLEYIIVTSLIGIVCLVVISNFGDVLFFSLADSQQRQVNRGA